MNYDDYLEQLLDNGRKHVLSTFCKPQEQMTFIERYEFAGYLLQRDLATKPQDIGDILITIMETGGYYIGDLMAAYCVEDNANNAADLCMEIKKAVAAHYEVEMQQLLDAAWQNYRLENGFVPHENVSNGEITWIKRGV